MEQAGSYVDGERLRFDFSHFSAMTKEEIAKAEEIVNEQIACALPVITSVMSIEEAKKSGAMALFGEKYGETVRVVKMGDFSTELCGGTHVANTGAIANFKILSENGVAAGVRRIEALTGNGVLKYYEELESVLAEAAKTVKAAPSDLVERLKEQGGKRRFGRRDGSGAGYQRRKASGYESVGSGYERAAGSGGSVEG